MEKWGEEKGGKDEEHQSCFIESQDFIIYIHLKLHTIHRSLSLCTHMLKQNYKVMKRD